MPEKADYSIVRRVGSTAVLINALYGTVDLINQAVLRAYQDDLEGLSGDEQAYLLERKHLQEGTGAQRRALNVLCDERRREQKQPLRVYLPLTGSCNLACSYCFQQGYGLRGKGLSLNDLRNMERGIVKALRHPAYVRREAELVLYGGEPLLLGNRPLVDEALKYASDNDFKVSIITNGTTLDSYLDLLRSYKETLNQIVVTLDGDKRLHDACRHYPNGAGSYEQITANLKLLKGNRLPYRIRVNLDKKLYERLKREGGQGLLKNELVEIHRVTHERYDENVPLSAMLELCLDGKISIDAVAENQVVAFYNLMESERAFVPLCNNCPADSVLLFALDGSSLCSCNESRGDDMVVGSYSPDFKLFDFEIGIKPICEDCALRPLCGGGCRRMTRAIERTGDCPFYKDIIEMIDSYIKDLLDGAHAQ